MKAVTRLVAVLFGPGRRAGEMSAPGEADCRWRAVLPDRRRHAVDEEAAAADEYSAEPRVDVRPD